MTGKWSESEFINMPWCPKCRTEYREGFTVCADCKSELVESLEALGEVKKKLCIFTNPKICKYVLDYLKYSNIEADFGFDGPYFVLSVKDKDFHAALTAINAVTNIEPDLYSEKNIDSSIYIGSKKELAFKNQQEEQAAAGDMSAIMNNRNPVQLNSFEQFNSTLDLKQAAEENNEEFEFVEADKVAQQPKRRQPYMQETTIYTSRREVANETFSSGIMFICFGVIGIAFMVLNTLGIINLIAKGFSTYAMFALFAFMLVGGVWSIFSSKKIHQDADKEDNFVDELTKWVDENITLDILKQADNPDETDEFNYILRTVQFKYLIVQQFGQLESTFLDSYVEDYYNEHFEVN